jgi:hypothetical protein
VETAKSVAASSVARVGATIARHVAKHHAEEDVRCDLRCMRHSVAGRDRREFDAGIGHAETMGWIVEGDDGRYGAGPSRPAET